jgi:hypothetical protein
MGQLIPQVLLAITASQGAKEKEIQAAIKAYNAEAKKMPRKATGDRKTKKNLQKEMEDYKPATNEIQQLAKEFQRSRHLPNLDLVSWKRKIRNYERTVKEARERLEQAREQAAKKPTRRWEKLKRSSLRL